MPAWVRERRNDTVQHRKKPSHETYELLDEDFDDFDEKVEFCRKSAGKPTHSFPSEKMGKKAAHKSHDDGKNSNPCPHYRHCGGCQLQNMTYVGINEFGQFTGCFYRLKLARGGNFGRNLPGFAFFAVFVD